MSDTFGCVNNSIRLRSGQNIDLLNPSIDKILLSDIAGALSKICRFGGQINKFYSVAEHSVNCSKQAFIDGYTTDIQIACLLHDATEAYLGDVVKPLKIALTQYKLIETKMESVIFEKFKIDIEQCRTIVHKIDREMLIAERNSLFTGNLDSWTGESEIRKINADIECLPPKDAEELFMSYANNLMVGTIN